MTWDEVTAEARRFASEQIDDIEIDPGVLNGVARLVGTLETKSWKPPRSVCPNGDGGIVLNWYLDDLTFRAEVECAAHVVWMILKDSMIDHWIEYNDGEVGEQARTQMLSIACGNVLSIK